MSSETRWICDRCKETANSRSQVTSLEIGYPFFNRFIHLCDKCMGEFKNEFLTKPKPVPVAHKIASTLVTQKVWRIFKGMRIIYERYENER